ncbi:MFS transporter [Advenella sp. S44]|uniref:Bug family tripartite tricarboxylate transporter substrate binding protein n=1 Tax=Advenella sp. S44 TaxID=1982755 RepID=UPI000C2A10D5|nr:tripartite tricarboxylate transporter substrate-binding protein [Advenella sp. S44]PJX20378.1 MFS transporter [Advenella sp. S44]
MHQSYLRAGLLAVILACTTGLPTYAADKPPLKLVVGATPGGTTDRVARGIAQQMSGILGQTVIVENRPGAGGNIAADAVARAPKDGNTLLISFTSFTVNATLYKKLPFDPEKDFTPITMLAEVPSVLVARKNFPASDISSLIEMARKEPGKYSFAIGGMGSSLHMATASFEMGADIKGLNVPYKGTSPAMQDIVGEQVDLMFASAVNVMPLAGGERIKILGVTSPEPMKQFPSAPPIGDTVKGFSSKAWFGMFGPAGMSKERLAQLNDAAVKGAQHENFVKMIEPEGGVVVTSTPEEFARFVSEDIKRYADVVKFTGVTAD